MVASALVDKEVDRVIGGHNMRVLFNEFPRAFPERGYRGGEFVHAHHEAVDFLVVAHEGEGITVSPCVSSGTIVALEGKLGSITS